MPPPIITTGACVFQHHTVTCGLPPRERPLAAFAEAPPLDGHTWLASRTAPTRGAASQTAALSFKQYCPLCPNGPPETEVSKAATH